MSDDGDEYDFYPCLVDDAPASIFLNLRYEHEGPPAGADTLYWISIEMRDAAEHGIGSEQESQTLWPAEDTITARTTSELGLVFVGRLRSHGDWQMAFYGPGEQLDALRALAKDAIVDRRFDVRMKPDPDWSYYREFLLPDDERKQWMQDRRIVDVLRGQGDVLTTARRVDHYAYFAAAADRDAFMQAASDEGFTRGAAHDQAPGARPFSAHIYRDDCVELDHIHDVVMLLFDAALANHGEYDGWETSIEAPPPS